MSWFQLDPDAVAGRVRASGLAPKIPGLCGSIGCGVAGFTILSVAGFVPWAISGRWFYRHVGEAGLYGACALVFIGLSGPLLHRLVLGPGSLSRFYKLFAVTFASYSILWTIGWMALRGHPGSVAGLLAGAAAMGWMLARAFDARAATFRVVAILFVLSSLGYFIGGWVEAGVMGLREPAPFGATVSKKVQARTAMLLWGVFYGIGFGAGLGWALHLCQARTRAVLQSLAAEPKTAVQP